MGEIINRLTVGLAPLGARLGAVILRLLMTLPKI